MVTSIQHFDDSSYIAGEWSTLLGSHYYEALVTNGAVVDCSVIEFGSWQTYKPCDLPVFVLTEIYKAAETL